MNIGMWLGWQIDYLLFLQNFRDTSGHVLDKFFIHITTFGEVIIPFFIICLFYWVINKKVGTLIMWSYLFGFIANTIAKMTACIYRPWILDCRVCPLPEAIPMATGYSFPSGHTAGVMSVWGALAYSYWQNKLFRYICIFIILSVMISRNYLGVHTPQDVVVSFFISIAIIYIAKRLIDYSEKNENNCWKILCGVFFITLITLLYITLKSYPIHYLFGKILYDPCPARTDVIIRSGFIFGAFSGWILEKKYINFVPENGSILKKIIRFCLGILLVLGILSLPIPVFSPEIQEFIKLIILGLFVTYIYPLIIVKYRF